MSERSTAEIVADLQRAARTNPQQVDGNKLRREAADRLEALDARVSDLRAKVEMYEGTLDWWNAIRPPCPTCGGRRWVPGPAHSMIDRTDPCPDCTDGKASVEWMARLFTAIMDLPINEWDQFRNPVAAAIVHLRTTVR